MQRVTPAVPNRVGQIKFMGTLAAIEFVKRQGIGFEADHVDVASREQRCVGRRTVDGIGPDIDHLCPHRSVREGGQQLGRGVWHGGLMAAGRPQGPARDDDATDFFVQQQYGWTRRDGLSHLERPMDARP
ncbi:MAG: hypothetical protein HC888_13760 [Candidatus Competibacteraceae bacterium]|nr:hypothetical protein [Candidatus Competibacteraceae bacterium]